MSTLTLLLAALLASVAATGTLQVLLTYVEPSGLEALTDAYACRIYGSSFECDAAADNYRLPASQHTAACCSRSLGESALWNS